jgi:hypothetical protein
MFYEDVFRKLGEKRIRYAVAGGVALVLHGVVRFTADLDIIVELSRDNLEKFITCINELGFSPRVPVDAKDFIDPEMRKQWIEEKGMKVLTFYHPQRQINQIDVFVNEPLKFEDIEKEIVWIKAKDITIPVVSIPHLKMLKKISGRPQDIADIEAIEELEKMENKRNE